MSDAGAALLTAAAHAITPGSTPARTVHRLLPELDTAAVAV